jgi:hypothetical protein
LTTVVGVRDGGFMVDARSFQGSVFETILYIANPNIEAENSTQWKQHEGHVRRVTSTSKLSVGSIDNVWLVVVVVFFFVDDGICRTTSSCILFYFSDRV